MNTASPVPVTTIGGYLGSGKTTLINHLLRNANGLRLAILVNEFGDLSIDEDLIEAQSDDVISIAGGCICCSFGDDLTGALIRLAEMHPRPDNIVIEASGVAIPGAIVSTLSLNEAFVSDGIVIVADADTIETSSDDEYIGDTIQRQLKDAEILILNKLDLVSEKYIVALENWLKEMAPNASVIPAEYSKVTVEAVLGAVSNPGQGASGGHSDWMFDSVVLEQVEGIDPSTLARELAIGPYGVIRAKGFCTDRDGKCNALQIVGNKWNVSDFFGDVKCSVVCLGLRHNLKKSSIIDLTAKIKNLD